jgi:hypothetical protein
MDNETINKIERLKDKADLFCNKNIKAIVKKYNKDFYFCDILIVGEDSITVSNFAGHRYGQQDRIYWIDIFDIDEYVEERK